MCHIHTARPEIHRTSTVWPLIGTLIRALAELAHLITRTDRRRAPCLHRVDRLLITMTAVAIRRLGARVVVRIFGLWWHVRSRVNRFLVPEFIPLQGQQQLPSCLIDGNELTHILPSFSTE